MPWCRCHMFSMFMLLHFCHNKQQNSNRRFWTEEDCLDFYLLTWFVGKVFGWRANTRYKLFTSKPCVFTRSTGIHATLVNRWLGGINASQQRCRVPFATTLLEAVDTATNQLRTFTNIPRKFPGSKESIRMSFCCWSNSFWRLSWLHRPY